MKKMLFSLTRLLTMIAFIVLFALVLFPVSAFARDLGPQFAESTIRTNNTIVAIPIGETGRFMPQYLVLRGVPAGSTQAISYVASGHTGVVSAATTASLIALTNIPPMFFGDYFLVVPNGLSSTNTFKARTIGAVFD